MAHNDFDTFNNVYSTLHQILEIFFSSFQVHQVGYIRYYIAYYFFEIPNMLGFLLWISYIIRFHSFMTLLVSSVIYHQILPNNHGINCMMVVLLTIINKI